MSQISQRPAQKKRFRHAARRMRFSIATLATLAALAVLVYAQDQSLWHSGFTSGYLLLGSVVFLAAFNLRKKLAFLPAFGTTSFWMQLHIYVGFSTFAVFGLHIAWRFPTGLFDCFLAALYLTVAISGVYGLYVTRIYPAKLRHVDEEVIFERIPALRQGIAQHARSLVVQACESSDVLAKFYLNRLASYFDQPRNLAYLIRPNTRKRRELIGEIDDLDRYLSDTHRGLGKQLSAMIMQRDDLDYHYALQGRLKTWMFVHVGLTYSLLAVAVLHMVLAHAFSGSLP